MMLRLSTAKPFITPSKLEALKTRGLYHNTHVCPEAILMYSIAQARRNVWGVYHVIYIIERFFC